MRPHQRSPVPRGDGASHEFVDHTSELVIRLWASTFGELLAEAARSLGELMTRSGAGTPETNWRELTVRASDEAALLVALLNELVFLGEVECWAPVDVSVDEVGPSGAEARVRVRGVHLDEPFVLVKAATLHGLSIRRSNGIVEAEVTLDV